MKSAQYLSTFMLYCLVVRLGLAASLTETERPHLMDWNDAMWFDDLVKIPLLIDEKTVWYANLIAGGASDSDPIQNGGYCMLDNQSAYTVIFPDETTDLPWFSPDSGDAVCSSSSST